jgi:hypothetical protein
VRLPEDVIQNFKLAFLDFFLFMFVIQHFFICRPSDSTVSEDAGIRTVATLALIARRSKHSRQDLIMG